MAPKTSGEDITSKHAKAYEFLKQVRASKTVSLKPTPMLKAEIVGLDGKKQALKIRYYQVQAIMHLLTMKRMVLGDATGTGKTLVVIASLCYAWDKEPENKAVIVCPKSALRQWASEFAKFSNGIKTYLVTGSPENRKAVYEAFKAHPTTPGSPKAVLLIGYALLVRDWNAGSTRPLLENGQPNMKVPPSLGLLNGTFHGNKNLVVVFDEATAFKNPKTKTWQVCSELSAYANRCYGLTATLLKNNLMEGFAIFKVIYPQVFTTITAFMRDFCHVRLQPVGGGRKIPIVVGYKNLDAFRARIDLFFLGRPKHEISDELPKLITREVGVEMDPAEEAKYDEALSGILSLGDGEVRDYSENKRLVALIYCQRIVDALALLKFEGGSEIETGLYKDTTLKVGDIGSKEQALLDLITEEFDDEKVIVYTRFASHVPRLRKLLKAAKIESVAVTGNENDKQRQAAQTAFQDLNSKVRVIFISDAGSEAINLQAASAMIFYNAPWSWGNYVQLLGRPIRIGSPHQHVVAVHLVAERPKRGRASRKTIDHYTLAILQGKKDLIDKVLGESAVGALDFESGSSFSLDLMRALRSDGGKPAPEDDDEDPMAGLV